MLEKSFGNLTTFRYFLLYNLLFIHQAHEAEAAIPKSAAAVIGAAQLLSMLLIAAAVGGMFLVLIIYFVYKLVRRYVFGIKEPKKNFVVDKKVKCRSGIHMNCYWTIQYVWDEVLEFVIGTIHKLCNRNRRMGEVVISHSFSQFT